MLTDLCSLLTADTKIVVKGSGKEQVIGGQKYVQVDKLKTKINVGGVNFKFINKNPADAVIGELPPPYCTLPFVSCNPGHSISCSLTGHQQT
ncbi:hypothetical protein PR048_027351 [Dryococelus australis]|uniref:Uncharacterized protein n=1 Tax=Dryococelus australis TaxID=614101 RepID=A0ABQ9GGD7_9NEOP|nr:hypothetical protein PR048_027351 [Dryococelus australis]